MRLSSSRFDEAVATHRRELLAHCYRMLGSPHDAEDALQEALVGAWKGWDGFEGRSSVRTWLFRIATNACLKQVQRRPARVLSTDLGPGFTQTADLGELDTAHQFLEPWASEPDDTGDPEAAYARREGVELAYVAALQHLPGTQRAVLVLREVLQFSATEVAELLDTSVPSVNSALQRARASLEERTHGRSQQAELAALGEDGVRRLLDEFVSAWEAADVDRMADLLAEDARFTMPPLPAWFDGREMVLRFIAERMFEVPWQLERRTVNGQPGFLCRMLVDGVWQLGAVNAIAFRDGLVTHIAAFVDPEIIEEFVVRTDESMGSPASAPV